MDQLTKFVFVLPCTLGPDHSFGAGGTADLVVRHIVCKYSVLRFIVHDQDACFTAEL